MKTFTITKQVSTIADQEAVFEILTTPAHITQYYPYHSVESAWQIGSELLFKGTTEAGEFTDYAVIEELTRPCKFGYRYWSDNHGTERISENYLSISYGLKPLDSGTHIQVTHSNIRSEQYFLAMDTIWVSLLENLKTYAESLERNSH